MKWTRDQFKRELQLLLEEKTGKSKKLFLIKPANHQLATRRLNVIRHLIGIADNMTEAEYEEIMRRMKEAPYGWEDEFPLPG